MKVDLSSLPIMINSNQYHSDISTFLGSLVNNTRLEKLEKIINGIPEPTILPICLSAMDKSVDRKDRRVECIS